MDAIVTVNRPRRTKFTGYLLWYARSKVTTEERSRKKDDENVTNE